MFYPRGHSGLGYSSLVALAAGLTAMPTAAQQASAPIVAADAAEEKAAGEMVVTGSRIVRDGSSAPVPTTVVTMEDIILMPMSLEAAYPTTCTITSAVL